MLKLDIASSDPGAACNALLLRLYLSEDDQVSGRPLYDVVCRKAREMKLKGLAVLRGPRGLDFGHRRAPAKLLSLLPQQNLPLIVEIIDRPESVRALLESIAPIMRHGLATLQEVYAWSFGEAGISDVKSASDRHLPL